ncbi:CBS domain-containing protein [Pyrinomonas methylaliphatogenes]|jgi:CBS domain-containing protein|uniref:CBS-domain-containing membrane protein n=1 Tax=Pyrinomonas methylaliphatogenes TaxID=454194 RepID=A0A0B6X4I2_9BACT|nr:CBS domain-containing protein [Pyrinomonas methylaliphatogenes]MBX5477716.1 CBS domain-containing protein [Pyrinomonas methylaliphatogenes]CDM67095.1 CBS-domain-containing membrane protein [Pyrinomonas methylaliphatogenes]
MSKGKGAREDHDQDHAFGYEGRRTHILCRDIMTREVTVATRDATLEQIAKWMLEEDTGIIPIVDPVAIESAEAAKGEGRNHGKLVGLITDRDIVIRAIAMGKDPRTTRVEEVMTTEVHTAQPDDRVVDVIRKMGDKQVRRIPVVDQDGNLRGIISMADIALETEEDRELAHALEEISSGHSFWSRFFD